jgi:probable O-glycosylation ligase (exosortase A-associated)
MRDVLVTLVVFGSLPIILVRPYVGILVWSWLGYMNPQRLTWGFAYEIPFSLCVAIVTLVAILFSREPKRIPVTWLTALWIIFLMWMNVTTYFAFYSDAAWLEWERIMKIQLMTFATLLVMTSRERIRMLVWVIVLSLGYYGVRGGIFTIMTGGSFQVWGPDYTFIAGNNEIALALLMTLPLMQYLRITSSNRWIRAGLLIAMVLCAFSIVGSQSRGAFVGGFAMAVLLWFKSKRKSITGAVLLVLVPALFAFMPEQWHERMRTIESYEADTSAMSRIYTWRMAVRVADDNLLGGGFGVWTQEAFDRYSPEYREPHDAHSIYFKVLGEHGWPGLLLFLGIIVLAWRTGTEIIRRTAQHDELRWLSELARMTQVSLVAFATGGAFLSLSYFDLYWHMVALFVLGSALVERHLAGITGWVSGNRRTSTIDPRAQDVRGEGMSRI